MTLFILVLLTLFTRDMVDSDLLYKKGHSGYKYFFTGKFSSLTKHFYCFTPKKLPDGTKFFTQKNYDS